MTTKKNQKNLDPYSEPQPAASGLLLVSGDSGATIKLLSIIPQFGAWVLGHG